MKAISAHKECAIRGRAIGKINADGTARKLSVFQKLLSKVDLIYQSSHQDTAQGGPVAGKDIFSFGIGIRAHFRGSRFAACDSGGSGINVGEPQLGSRCGGLKEGPDVVGKKLLECTGPVRVDAETVSLRPVCGRDIAFVYRETDAGFFQTLCESQAAQAGSDDDNVLGHGVEMLDFVGCCCGGAGPMSKHLPGRKRQVAVLLCEKASFSAMTSEEV